MLLSCEHAFPALPEPYVQLLTGARHLLHSHRSYDIGAAPVCRGLEGLAEAAFYGECSRLLIDLNRSLHHRGVFSDFSKHLPRAARAEVVARYYTPFRNAVLAAVEEIIARDGEVLHLSVHSFTPVLLGVVRSNDIGLLYDPRREGEGDLARRWAAAMRSLDPHLSLRMNHPYRGVADGHPTALRRRCGDRGYLGLELEINQNLVVDDRGRSAVVALLADGLRRCGIGRG
nr:N-formylglutamate amidohydrolase [Desulfoprunum benzoelyticum]